MKRRHSCGWYYANPICYRSPQHYCKKPDCFSGKNKAVNLFSSSIKRNASTKLKKIFLIQPGCEDFGFLFRKTEVSDQVIQLEFIKWQRCSNCALKLTSTASGHCCDNRTGTFITAFLRDRSSCRF